MVFKNYSSIENWQTFVFSPLVLFQVIWELRPVLNTFMHEEQEQNYYIILTHLKPKF